MGKMATPKLGCRLVNDTLVWLGVSAAGPWRHLVFNFHQSGNNAIPLILSADLQRAFHPHVAGKFAGQRTTVVGNAVLIDRKCRSRRGG